MIGGYSEELTQVTWISDGKCQGELQSVLFGSQIFYSAPVHAVVFSLLLKNEKTVGVCVGNSIFCGESIEEVNPITLTSPGLHQLSKKFYNITHEP